MRITPIAMAYNRQNLKSQNNQNVNFGKFENTETKQYVKQNILNPNKHGDSAREALDYFDKSDLVTIKRKKGLVYAVAEKGAINKHKNRELFEDMILNSYRNFDFWLTPETRPKALKHLNATVENVFCDFEKELPGFDEKASIVKGEPGYLTTIDDFSAAHNLYEDFINAETGHVPFSSGTSSPEKYEPDAWDKAHDWLKN